MQIKPDNIVKFWREAGPEKWYAKDENFDQDIRVKFLAAHEAAARGELSDWESNAGGALALLLLLDQFPRNLFRDSAHAFATDPMALNIAKRSIAHGYDGSCEEIMKQFFYMPLMHSENIEDQNYCLALCQQSGGAENIEYAIIHRDIIARFGRFPHRNPVFGRVNSDEEDSFLDEGGFAG